MTTDPKSFVEAFPYVRSNCPKRNKQTIMILLFFYVLDVKYFFRYYFSSQ